MEYAQDLYGWSSHLSYLSIFIKYTMGYFMFYTIKIYG